jgi:hypothetical protein
VLSQDGVSLIAQSRACTASPAALCSRHGRGTRFLFLAIIVYSQDPLYPFVECQSVVRLQVCVRIAV